MSYFCKQRLETAWIGAAIGAATVGGEEESFVAGGVDGHFDAAEFVVDSSADDDGAGFGFGCAVEADDVTDEFEVFAGGRFAKDAPDFFDDVF